MYFRNMSEVSSYYAQSPQNLKRSWIVFLGDQSQNMLVDLITFCNNNQIDLMGGIYPGLLVKDKYHRTGLILLEIEPIYKAKALPHVMRSFSNDTPTKNKAAIILSDGLSPHYKVLMDTIYSKVGSDVSYIGGGAGFYDMIHRSCIFDNKGIYKDVALVAVLDQEAIIRYRHGWERLEGPFIATKTKDNVLSEINGVPAAQFYKRLIIDYVHADFDDNPSFYFKAYPFGIEHGSEIDIVRDPIEIIDQDEILCVAGINQNSNIYLLHGNVDTLLNSSLDVAKACKTNQMDNYMVLLFDCITRATYLGTSFKTEVANIQEIMDVPVYGALSIGEVSSLSNGELKIHNKSTVLGVINKDK